MASPMPLTLPAFDQVITTVIHDAIRIPKLFFSTFGWYSLFVLIVLYELRRMLWTLWWKAPKNVKTIGYPTIFGKYLMALRTLFDSEGVILRAYGQSDGEPFAIPFLDRYVVFIPDRMQAKMLEQETSPNLSDMEALRELSFTNHVLGNAKISSAVGHESSVGALKKHLRTDLPAKSLDIQLRAQKAFDTEFEDSPLSNAGDDSSGEPWRQLDLVPALLRVVTRINAPVWVGEEYGNQEQTFELLMSFFWSCLSTIMLVTLAPPFLATLIVPLIVGRDLSKSKLYQLLLKLARSSEDNKIQDQKPKQHHLVEWISNILKISDVVEVTKCSLGLIFASAFQVPMLLLVAIFNLAKMPEYIPSLREEAVAHGLGTFTSKNTELPLIDSFVKETARLDPALLLAAPRLVVKTYLLSDNIVVPSGNWIAVPHLAVMRDPSIWANADDFDGKRFVDESGQSISRYTDVTYEFPYWGPVNHACPARFYAAILIKVCLVHLLCHYDFELEKPNTRLVYGFSLFRLTNPKIRLRVRRRAEQRFLGFHGEIEMPGGYQYATEPGNSRDWIAEAVGKRRRQLENLRAEDTKENQIKMA